MKVASVATAFPSGQSPIDVKLADVRRAVELGADEIDMVIDRGAMLSGDYAKVFDEIAATKEACGKAHLKDAGAVSPSSSAAIPGLLPVSRSM